MPSAPALRLSALARAHHAAPVARPARRKEREALLTSLSRRATRVAKALNELEGVTCNEPEGAMYLFPMVTMPKQVVALAEEQDRSPEYIYCMELLEQVGGGAGIRAWMRVR